MSRVITGRVMTYKLMKLFCIILFTGLGLEAQALPPPDSIDKCRINEALQVHHWESVYGESQTLYFKVSNFSNPFGPWRFTKISKEDYVRRCRRKLVKDDIIHSYKNLDSSIFENVSDQSDKPLFSVTGHGLINEDNSKLDNQLNMQLSYFNSSLDVVAKE